MIQWIFYRVARKRKLEEMEWDVEMKEWWWCHADMNVISNFIVWIDILCINYCIADLTKWSNIQCISPWLTWWCDGISRRGGVAWTSLSLHITKVALFWWVMCKTFTIVSSESSASVVSAEHCSTTSTTWSVTNVAAAHGPTPMFLLWSI